MFFATKWVPLVLRSRFLQGACTPYLGELSKSAAAAATPHSITLREASCSSAAKSSSSGSPYMSPLLLLSKPLSHAVEKKSSEEE